MADNKKTDEWYADQADTDEFLDFENNQDMGSKGGQSIQSAQDLKKQTSKKGFAKMIQNDPQRQRMIASKGGRAAHQKGTAHEWTSKEAKEAGRRGGRSKSSQS